MIEDSFFQEELGRTGLHNNYTEYIFRNLLAKLVTRISTSLKINRYV